MRNFSNNFITIHDTYEIDPNSIIEIYCPNKYKDPVKALYTGDFDFSMVSEWENALGVLADSNVISFADNIAQKIFGVTVNQPFLQRQTWKGNQPLAWKIPIRFVARKNAFEDVMDPINKIMSMMIMRDANYNLQTFLNSFSKGGNTQTQSSTAQSTQDHPKPDSSINASDFKVFIIPGPYPFSTDTTGKEQKGDVVQVKIGNIIEYKVCYITEFSGKLTQQHDYTGQSIAADCTLSFRAMDNLVFGVDGKTPNFFKQSFMDSTIADKLGDVMTSTLQNLSKVVTGK
jgi:hypothetical protein